MQALIRWVRHDKTWSRSVFSDLPAIPLAASSIAQYWFVLAGGLALVLSRASETEIRARFPSSHHLYMLLRRRLKKGERVTIEAELLNDSLHEVTGVVDPMTKTALAAALRACHQRVAKVDPRPSALPSRLESVTSRPATCASSMPELDSRPPHLDGGTGFLNSDVFIERSSALRRTVASARATNLGGLN